MGGAFFPPNVESGDTGYGGEGTQDGEAYDASSAKCDLKCAVRARPPLSARHRLPRALSYVRTHVLRKKMAQEYRNRALWDY